MGLGVVQGPNACVEQQSAMRRIAIVKVGVDVDVDVDVDVAADGIICNFDEYIIVTLVSSRHYWYWY